MATLSSIITPTNVETASSTSTLTNKTIDGDNNTITNIDLAGDVKGTLPVANGGTGATSLTANNVLLGNGTSAVQVVAPGSSGNVLTSNGTTWQSTAPAGGGAMELISTTTISGTPSTIDITSGFSSTYDDYVIYASNITSSAAGVLTLQLYLGGVLNTGTNYFYTRSNTSAFTAQTNESSIECAYIVSSDATGFKVEIVSANSTAASSPVVNVFGRTRTALMGRNSSSGGITGVRFLVSATTFTSGSIRLYGIKK